MHNLIARILAGDIIKNHNGILTSAAPEQVQGENWLPKLKGRILLAEDNLVNQEVAPAMLQRMGICAKIAGNGLDATKFIEDESFDLVLMDCHMPIMDGFEATQRIRSREMNLALPKLPIIALTANAIIGDRENCLAKGMDDYLSKPFTIEQLHKVLLQWLPLREHHDLEERVVTDEPVIKVKIDQKVLTQLKNLKAGLLVRIIDLYIESSPQLLLDMEQAVAQQDTNSLYKVAHSLKNSSANLGITDLTNLCRELEIKGREGDLAASVILVADIKRLYSLVAAALLGIKNKEAMHE